MWCPECMAINELEVVTWPQLRSRAVVAGVGLRLPPATAEAYWWCDRCKSGGAFVVSPAEGSGGGRSARREAPSTVPPRRDRRRRAGA